MNVHDLNRMAEKPAVKSGSKAYRDLASGTFVVLLVLKLAHFINWTWWLVTLPLWGGFALAMGVITAVLASDIIKRRLGARR